MKKVFTFSQTNILVNIPLLSTAIIIAIVMSLQSASCSDPLKNEKYYFQGKEVQSSQFRAQPAYNDNNNLNNYLKASSTHFHTLYADPSKHFNRMGPTLTPSQSPSSIQHQPYVLRRQEANQIMLTNENANMESTGESTPEEGNNEENVQDEDNSPFEQALEDLTTPGKVIPIINTLTLVALIILHLPAIVPTILIPLIFYCIGALLIPIVRINYFINHEDDGEDGRRSLDFINSLISNLFQNIL